MPGAARELLRPIAEERRTSDESDEKLNDMVCIGVLPPRTTNGDCLATGAEVYDQQGRLHALPQDAREPPTDRRAGDGGEKEESLVNKFRVSRQSVIFASTDLYKLSHRF